MALLDNSLDLLVRIIPYKPTLLCSEGKRHDAAISFPGLFPWRWEGREKTLASAGHVSILHPEILGVINLRGLRTQNQDGGETVSVKST